MTAQLLPGDGYGQDEPGWAARHSDRAQPIPRNRGCSMAALYTITFQAPAFYERQGIGCSAQLNAGVPATPASA
jgi:hypothetical protein